MAYAKVKGKTIDEYYQIFCETYCNHSNPILTFDKILVKFFPDMFYHAFYESDDFKKKDKSLFSYNRAEKILWIKDTLLDKSAILKKGWDSKNKTYDNTRRVAIVKKDYVVIIRLLNINSAKFITAFQHNNIERVPNSPNWL
jgi:hypothetical protein